MAPAAPVGGPLTRLAALHNRVARDDDQDRIRMWTRMRTVNLEGRSKTKRISVPHLGSHPAVWKFVRFSDRAPHDFQNTSR